MNDLIDDFFKQKVLFSQYENYPAQNKNGWIKFLHDRFKNIPPTGETKLLKTEDNNSSILLELNIWNWDYSHFGYKIAKFNNPIVINECKIISAKDIINKAIDFCLTQNVKLITSRVNGDNLNFLHSLEDKGFRYYETVIWSLLDVRKSGLAYPTSEEITYINASQEEVDLLKHIAKKDQYQRGHFHCDEKIDKRAADLLYAKWVQTAIESGRKIAVLKKENRIVGYFVCQIDETFNSYFNVKYGRFQSLAVDSDHRGKGLGRRLFSETIGLLKNEGCLFIDSGYSTKNHKSAKLHTENGFSSVYEEITMHRWL